MAVMSSETLASEATSIASSEDVVKEIGSDLSELAEGKKDDTPKNIARIYKVTEANQVVKSSESQGGFFQRKRKISDFNGSLSCRSCCYTKYIYNLFY